MLETPWCIQNCRWQKGNERIQERISVVAWNGRRSERELMTVIIPGGLFDMTESKQEVAFRYAVERVNANRKILTKSLLSAQLEKIPPQDSFHASKRGKQAPYFRVILHGSAKVCHGPKVVTISVFYCTYLAF